jgi:hypothetical protein
MMKDFPNIEQQALRGNKVWWTKYGNDLTEFELNQHVNDLAQSLNSFSEPIYIVAQLREKGQRINLFALLKSLKKVDSHPNCRGWLAVKTNLFSSQIAEMLVKVGGLNKVKFFRNVDEVNAFLDAQLHSAA